MADPDLHALLETIRTIAIVGLSADPRRSSNDVAAFLMRRGYHCVGVSPAVAGQEVHGIACVARLADLPYRVDMVEIFRASEHAGAFVVDEALALAKPPRVIWMQLGVIDGSAKARAEAAGTIVVMDRCPKIEIMRSAREAGESSRLEHQFRDGHLCHLGVLRPDLIRWRRRAIGGIAGRRLEVARNQGSKSHGPPRRRRLARQRLRAGRARRPLRA